MAKKKPEAPGAPLPAHFHPKDSPHGIICRNDLSLASNYDLFRKTVLIYVGSTLLEMTAEAAERFADQLRCSIDRVKQSL